MAMTNSGVRIILKSGAVTADTVSSVMDAVMQDNLEEARTHSGTCTINTADRRARHVIMAAKLLAAISVLLPGMSPPVYAHDDHDYYERPAYQGGLIDSYDRYNPQLHRWIYPDRVLNVFAPARDHEREPYVSPRHRCLYFCETGDVPYRSRDY